MREDVFSSQKLSKVKAALCSEDEVLYVHKIFHNVQLNEVAYGSRESRHSKSAIIFAKPLDGSSSKLAEIEEFIECIVSSSSPESEGDRVYLVGIYWFIQHECKVWFGHPVQVWSDMHTSSIAYIPLCNISSPAVYTHSDVDFGRAIGCHRVIVAIPCIARA